MAGWNQESCGNCGRDLPERGYKIRRVPGRRGRRLKVCADCAEAIDAQATLAEPDGHLLGQPRR